MALPPTATPEINTSQEGEEKHQDELQASMESMISTLPKEKGWRNEYLLQYQGHWYPSYFVPAIISIQNHFRPTPAHVLLATHPKSGTTWLKALTFAISVRHDHHETHPLLTTNPQKLVPFLEGYALDHIHDPTPSALLLSTHIPFASLPRSVFDAKCRILYACRDPKDVLVSFWHFYRSLKRKEQPPDITLEEAAEMFARGVSTYGPYWDHVLGYWRARSETMMMFLRYEDLQRDPVFYTRRLAEFIGRPFSAEEERAGAVEEIVELCSFKKLSALEANKTGMFWVDPPVPNSAFFRKGKEGDSRNYLSAEMIERLDRITEEKFKGSGVIP